ncbi:hypothetical protein [Bartonella tribocorum]|uniref:hypothetical protein n=1 Tax=Bartonella tribocorum TaxID=85701 RepID=UPI00056EC06C|nr:hypothetical protein [Bartonella tribocorum]
MVDVGIWQVEIWQLLVGNYGKARSLQLCGRLRLMVRLSGEGGMGDCGQYKGIGESPIFSFEQGKAKGEGKLWC